MMQYFIAFIPMLDKTGFAFKINADFSTDPSRKHLIQDDLTTEAFAKAAKLLASFVENVFKEKMKNFMDYWVNWKTYFINQHFDSI